MEANPILLQKKYACVIEQFAADADIPLRETMEQFYYSVTYGNMREGLSDMHCRSDEYLAQELMRECKNKI